MKLSITQFEEIFGKQSITAYTKFNWLGEYPTVARWRGTTNELSINLATDYHWDAGKYEVELIKRNMNKVGTTTDDDNGYVIFQFYSGKNITNITVANKKYLTIPEGTGYVVLFPNGWNSTTAMDGWSCDYDIIIRKVVDNLVEGCSGYNSTILKHTSNDIQDYEWINTDGGYGGPQKIYNNSNFSYGDYRLHFYINYSSEYLKYYIFNITKSKVIKENIGNDTIFTLTPENYSVGDGVLIRAYMSSVGATASISNFYVCKIQDDWKYIDAGSLDWLYRSDITSVNTFAAQVTIKQGESGQPQNICFISGYVPGIFISRTDQITENKKIYCLYSGVFLYVTNNDYTDSTAFKTALSGKILMYK